MKWDSDLDYWEHLNPPDGVCRYCLATPEDQHQPDCPNVDQEPPEDGEAFRGTEKAAYDREQMAAWQLLK